MASWATTKHRGGPEPDAQTDGARSDRDQHGIVAACRRPDPSGDERRNRLHDVHWGDQRAINGAVGFPADHLRYRQAANDGEHAVGGAIDGGDGRDGETNRWGKERTRGMWGKGGSVKLE